MTNVRKKIKHLRSNQTVTVNENGVEKTKPLAPGLDDIDVGEIAINYAAGHEKIYVKNDDNFGGNQEVVGFANDNELNEMGEILSLAISEEKTARENAISGLNHSLLHDLTISTDEINPEYETGYYYITPTRGYNGIKFNSEFEAGSIICSSFLDKGSNMTIAGTTLVDSYVLVGSIKLGNALIESEDNVINIEELNVLGTEVNNRIVASMQLGDTEIRSDGIGTLAINNRQLNINGFTNSGVKIAIVKLGDATIYSNNGTIITDKLKATRIAVGNANLTSSGYELRTNYLRVDDELYVSTISNSNYHVNIGTLKTNNLTVNQDLNINGQIISKDIDGVVRVAGTLIDSQITAKFGIGNATINTFGDEINVSNLNATYFTSHSMSDIDSINTKNLETNNINITGKIVDNVKVSAITLGDATLTSSGTTLKTDELHVTDGVEAKNISAIGEDYNNVRVSTINIGRTNLNSSGTLLKTDYFEISGELDSNNVRIAKLILGNAVIESEDSEIKISNLKSTTLNATTISGTNITGTNISGSSLVVEGPNMTIAGATFNDHNVLVGSINIGDAVIGAENRVINLEELNVFGTDYNNDTIGTIQIGATTISATNDIINIGNLSTNGVLSVVGTKEQSGEVINVGTIKLGDATISATSGTISVDVIKATQEIDVGVARITSIGDKLQTHLYYRPSILTGAGELFENVYTVEETLTKIIASLNSHNLLP